MVPEDVKLEKHHTDARVESEYTPESQDVHCNGADLHQCQRC